MSGLYILIAHQNLASESPLLLEREKELQIRSQNLEEMNIALRVLLNKRDKDKMELEEKVLTNVKELVAPHLERLKNSGLNERQIAIANVLVSSLEDIISSFSRRLTKTYLCFTSTEIQIADLVKYGKTSKEIAEFLGVCNETINFHRKNIRRKIGLRNKKSSLRAFLLSIN